MINQLIQDLTILHLLVKAAVRKALNVEYKIGIQNLVCTARDCKILYIKDLSSNYEIFVLKKYMFVLFFVLKIAFCTNIIIYFKYDITRYNCCTHITKEFLNVFVTCVFPKPISF